MYKLHRFDDTQSKSMNSIAKVLNCFISSSEICFPMELKQKTFISRCYFLTTSPLLNCDIELNEYFQFNCHRSVNKNDWDIIPFSKILYIWKVLSFLLNWKAERPRKRQLEFVFSFVLQVIWLCIALFLQMLNRIDKMLLWLAQFIVEF